MAREDFELEGNKPIGRGSFGTVFAARRIADDRRVALKLVLHNGEWGPERIEAERKGAILQQRFAQAHGMVPEVYDCGADGDDFFIAMEFIQGQSLEGLLRRRRLDPDEAAEHALWMCGFLEKAHAFCEVVEGKPYRIVHTDLKPAHLMISPDGDVRAARRDSCSSISPRSPIASGSGNAPASWPMCASARACRPASSPSPCPPAAARP